MTEPRSPRVGDEVRLSWRYRLWGRFMWLPERAYYRLGDVLVGLDGWRPLHMRHPEWFRGEQR